MRTIPFTLAIADLLVSPLMLLIYMRALAKANATRTAPVAVASSPAKVAPAAQLSTQPGLGT